MQIPGETAAPLIKRLRGVGWSAGGAGWTPGRVRPREGAAGAPGEGARASGDLQSDNRAKGEIALETHTSPQAAAGAGAKEAGREGGKSRREGPTGGTTGGRGGRARGRDEASWWKQRPSTPGPPRSPARQGEPCQGPARPLLPLPARSPPGNRESRTPAEPTSRSQRPTPHLARSGARSSVREAPTQCLVEKAAPFPGDSGWLCPAPLACALHSLDAFGPSPALQIITERLLCGGPGVRAGRAGG